VPATPDLASPRETSGLNALARWFQFRMYPQEAGLHEPGL
jgi:hypothetical protein